MVGSSLDRKLFRDLSRIKGQASAIAIVIALGVMMLVMMDGLVNTLDETRRAYYERYRLADVFAPVKRAPRHVVDKISALSGVDAAEGRIVGGALITLPYVSVPLQAKAVSLPDFNLPRLNDYRLSKGRKINPQHADEVLVLESFAIARDLSLGSKLAVTMNGARRTFTIVGFAQSPEFLYTTAPGELVPDDGRFAVLWMSETALEAAFDMKGAFNEFLVALAPQHQQKEVINALDSMLGQYGALGAYGLKDQVSNRFVSEEISGLEASAIGVPPIFLGVAAFLLYIVVSRIVQSEREQIGLLKAFGYTDNEINGHYLKLVLIIAICGALLGSLMGVAAGRSLAGVYQQYFKFPFIVFQVDASAFLTGIVVSVITASVGGLLVLRQVFLLTPAVAMRPPAPVDYSHMASNDNTLKQWIDQPSRMVLRRVRRQFNRMFGAIVGVATGLALAAGMSSLLSGFDRTIELTFNILDRSDANVTFIHPLSNKTAFELQQVPGVLSVEPYRNVSVVFKYKRQEHHGAIEGLIEQPILYRALDAEQQPIILDDSGIVLSTMLAKKLDINVGETLTVDVREGRRPILHVPVTAISDTLLGSPTYMSLSGLNRHLKEVGRISGAYLTIDKKVSHQVYEKIKDMPNVAGVTLKQDSILAFEKMMDQGAGAMRYVMAIIAGVITFGIVYNAARIAYAERARDLASLRVIGFTKGEAAYVLLGELAVIVLFALPIGAALGYLLANLIAEGFSTDLYQVPSAFSLSSFAFAALSVIVAAIVSGWLVKRDVDKVDLVSALKSKE